MLDLKNLSTSPGVYIYKNSDNKIIYVGKAINLKKRVSQYFHSKSALGPKTKSLVSKITKIDHIPVKSEVEALVLEASLIKQYKPKYNSQLSDDKNYIYICITKEAYPRIFSAPKTKISDIKVDTYGPFPDSSSVRFILKTLRSVFPFRTFKKIHPRNCLYCHLGFCPGSAPDLIQYKKTIKKIKMILNGSSKKLIEKLQQDMYLYSSQENYSLALLRKKQIESLAYITNSWKNITNLTASIDLPQDKYLSALNELKSLFGLPKIDRIEAYDISNSSHFFVGSMVVFQKSVIDHSQYRQFKIKTKNSPDDQHMMAEVISRRLPHTNWQYPQIILVDGGIPQVAAVYPLLVNMNIYLIGLAKKEETIVTYNGNNFGQISLPKYSNALRLLQSLRDEAHRFANRYRKNLVRASFSKN